MVVDLGIQLALNGGNIRCVSLGQLAVAGALGAVGAIGVARVAALAKAGNATKGALGQFGGSIDDLSSAALQPFKNTSLTKAARALDKHAAGQRPAGTFPSLSENATAKNRQAQEIVNNILNNSKSQFKTLGRGGLKIRSPSGQGIRFDKDGSFSSFVD